MTKMLWFCVGNTGPSKKIQCVGDVFGLVQQLIQGKVVLLHEAKASSSKISVQGKGYGTTCAVLNQLCRLGCLVLVKIIFCTNSQLYSCLMTAQEFPFYRGFPASGLKEKVMGFNMFKHNQCAAWFETNYCSRTLRAMFLNSQKFMILDKYYSKSQSLDFDVSIQLHYFR